MAPPCIRAWLRHQMHVFIGTLEYFHVPLNDMCLWCLAARAALRCPRCSTEWTFRRTRKSRTVFRKNAAEWRYPGESRYGPSVLAYLILQRRNQSLLTVSSFFAKESVTFLWCQKGSNPRSFHVTIVFSLANVRTDWEQKPITIDSFSHFHNSQNR